jgi:nitric oxide reductase activation protein
LARLARALHDDTYRDDDAWVSKGRESFLAARASWHDADLCRRIGSALGNDLGQMRVQFDAKNQVVEPAYRDDHSGLWRFEHESTEDGAEFESEGVRRVEAEAPTPKERERGAPQVAPALERKGAEHPSALQLAALRERPRATLHPEWDYVIQRERPDFCSVLERSPPPTDAAPPIATRDARAQRRLERAALRIADRHPQPIRRLLDGDRVDLSAAVAAVVARNSDAPPDPRVYRRVRFRLDPPALLLLLDLSESLNAPAPGAGTSLLQLAQSAATLLATSVSAATSDLAIHGFCSNGRHEVGYYRFKDFDDPYDEQTRARLAGMRAQLSTRLGTALRHAGRALSARPAPRKLLLVVTDGEPSDIDVHDDKYLLFDAKRATILNRKFGIVSFCIGLDAQAEGSVARIFGAGHYSLLHQLEHLPQRLAEVYQRLSA